MAKSKNIQRSLEKSAVAARARRKLAGRREEQAKEMIQEKGQLHMYSTENQMERIWMGREDSSGITTKSSPSWLKSWRGEGLQQTVHLRRQSSFVRPDDIHRVPSQKSNTFLNPERDWQMLVDLKKQLVF
ncbi:hypothetical protein QQF64_022336 [Cirrhinus molitorella]|uniref:Uncharacterized protein n=1 Tax=Cirrhinus molitorella TaxID=172907 RepID=A0ABR3LBW1_9TELE